MKRILFIAFAALTLVACNQNFGISAPIAASPEEKDSITNDFTLIKACIGISQEEVESLLVENGYQEVESDKYKKYQKTEDGITKELIIYAQNNLVGSIELYARIDQFETGRSIFVEWMNEIRKSKIFPKLVRTHYKLKINYEL